MNRKLLVTGANGLLGSALVARLAQRPEDDVVAIWREGKSRLPHDPPPHIRYQRCDLNDRSQVDALFTERFDAIIHLAALLPDGSPAYAQRAILANIVATAQMLDAAAGRAGRFVYCSSTSVYGGPCPSQGWTEDDPVAPASIYGWSKHAGEELVRVRSGEEKLEAISLRLAGIHGPGRTSGVVFNTIRAARARAPIRLNNAGAPFQLVFVSDAVDAILAAASTTSVPGGYARANVASHTFPTLRALATEIVALCGSATDFQASEEQSLGRHVMNTERMTATLGISPADVVAQLRQTIEWYAASNTP